MSDLISAAKNGYHDNLENLLSTGISCDQRDKDEATALYWGACRGHAKICETLLKSGCAVDAQVKWGSSALHAASDRGHLECIKLLISWGADLNLRNSRGDTPLHLAAYRGFADIVDALISAGANPFLQNQACKTPLQEAQCQSHTLAAQKLQAYVNSFNSSNSLPTSNETGVTSTHQSKCHPSWPQDHSNNLSYPSTRYGHINTAHPWASQSNSSLVSRSSHSEAGENSDVQGLYSMHASLSSQNSYDLQNRSHGNSLVNMKNLSNLDSVDLLKHQFKGTVINDSHLQTPMHDYLSIGSNGKVRNGGSSKTEFSNEKFSRSQSAQNDREVLENFADSLQMEVVKKNEFCQKLEIEMKMLQNKLRLLECQNADLATRDEINRRELCSTQETLAKERRKNFEVVKQQKLLSRSMSSSMPDRKLTSKPKRSKVTHEHLLTFVKSQGLNDPCNTTSQLNNLRSHLNQIWLQPCNMQRFDSGNEWVAGVDYDIIGDGPLNHLDDGLRSGSCSLVFQINRGGTHYVLKMMINLINLDYTEHNQGYSLDGFLIRNFGPEYHVPLLLSKHRNIVNVVHYFQGSTENFHKYQKLLIPSNLDVPIEMASRTSFLVLESYPQTLLSFMVNQRTICPAPCYGLPNSFLLLLLYQLLAVIEYLQCNHIVHRDIKGDNIFLDKCLRPVLADFGFARSLHTREGHQQMFVDKSQSLAGNSHAWAPELTRMHHAGPESLPRQTSLQEIYAKSDVFAVSRMFYNLLRPLGDNDSFPQSSVNEPHYQDSAIPDLPGSFSPGLRYVLHGLVLDNPEQRPTARQAMISVGILLFPPSLGDVNSPEDVTPFLQAQCLKVLALNRPSTDSDKVLNVDESIETIKAEVEASFLVNVTTKEFWEEYSDLKNKGLIPTA